MDARSPEGTITGYPSRVPWTPPGAPRGGTFEVTPPGRLGRRRRLGPPGGTIKGRPLRPPRTPPGAPGRGTNADALPRGTSGMLAFGP